LNCCFREARTCLVLHNALNASGELRERGES